MPKDYPRTLRIAEQIQRELADIIRLELKDPRIGMVTITGVEVSPDHAYAKVFFTLLGDAGKVQKTSDGLQHASGYLRSQLARRIKLRTVPQLRFKHDASVERGVNLSRLIDAAVASDSARSSNK
ncbi:MAG: ribosome-binding factor A [Betaproteobacteria bacterium RIFCSPLOWO2_12_FULL_62_13]|nr:MAG: ribosome-binding factor A [Betaproteobacteria bacterium RIFCSPLOWO2_12_FULL_62_13]